MATFQQWLPANLIVPAILVVLFIGSVNAFKCAPGYMDCDYDKNCETDVYNNVKNCGDCGAVCKESPEYFITKCINGTCTYSEYNPTGCDKVRCMEYSGTFNKCSDGKCYYFCSKVGWANCNNDWKDGCETYINTDINNCGKCGVTCKESPSANTVCIDGQCKYTCKAGWANCNSNWEDGCETYINEDINNCGNCGVSCQERPNTNTTCIEGKCNYTCKAGWANCNSNWEDGCETYIKGDLKNCGYCGAMCKELPNATVKCIDGQCEYTCKKGWANCNDSWDDGCETNVYNDVMNCGKCGIICKEYLHTANTTCINGQCKYNCNAGWATCNLIFTRETPAEAISFPARIVPCATDINNDVNNCGECGVMCNTYPNAISNCTNGHCEITCMEGWANCNGNWDDGCETDMHTDVKNCGGCGVKCFPVKSSKGQTACRNGYCVMIPFCTKDYISEECIKPVP